MVGVDFQIGKQKRLTAGLATAAIRLDSYEYRVDLGQCFRVITLKNPALLRAIVLIENAEVDGLLTVRAPPAPRLERAGTFQFGLLIQIVGIENQRLVSGIKDTTVRLPGFAGPGDVIDFRDIEIARTHYLAYVPVMAQEFIALLEGRLSLLKLT